MSQDIKKLFENRKGVIATMHKKEQVIAPILERELGLDLVVLEKFDTDAFGTFTNEVERAGDQLEAARKKAEKAMKQSGLSIGISSEGSFGPHPSFPFVPLNRELILFIDKEQNLEITSYVANTHTNYAQKTVGSFEEAHEFALSIGFPEHAVIVKTNVGTTNHDEIVKGITHVDDLHRVVQDLLKKGHTSLFIETDMRAMYNPTRMKNIERATLELVAKIKSICPACAAPGFEITVYKKGLRCQYCQYPTDAILAHVYECKKCHHKEETLYPNGEKYADPSRCNICNP